MNSIFHRRKHKEMFAAFCIGFVAGPLTEEQKNLLRRFYNYNYEIIFTSISIHTSEGERYFENILIMA